MKPAIKTSSLLFNRFVRLVEDNYEELTESFMNDLLRNPDTVAYRSADREIIFQASEIIYRDLSKWISREFSKEKIRERYERIGKERYNMDIPLDQVFKAMVLQRRHLWLFVIDKLYDDTTAYREALELNNRVTLYFDRAMYFMLHGYQRRMIA
jgi:hypothetical protein